MYCQDVSSFGNAPVKMCHLSAMHLSRCVIFWQGANIVYLFVVWCGLKCTLPALFVLSDVSSFGNTPVKMCHLSAGS